MCCLQNCDDKKYMCLYVKNGVGNIRKPAQCPAVTFTKDGMKKSSRNDFIEADKLFEYMIEPVPLPKFFK